MFEWSGFIILIVLLYAAIVAVAFVATAFFAFMIEEDGVALSNTAAIVAWVIFTLIGWSTLNGINYSVTSSDATISSNGQYAAAYFGLKSNVQYPLQLGSRFGGSSGSQHAKAVSGLFFTYASASSQLQPASALSIGYAYRGRSYILELPMSSITFVQSETVSPSVRLRLAKTAVTGFTSTKTYTACQFKIHNLVTECGRHQTGIKTTATKKAADKGLSSIVAKNLDSAVITLTPKMYQAVLGTP